MVVDSLSDPQRGRGSPWVALWLEGPRANTMGVGNPLWPIPEDLSDCTSPGQPAWHPGALAGQSLGFQGGHTHRRSRASSPSIPRIHVLLTEPIRISKRHVLAEILAIKYLPTKKGVIKQPCQC